jgi:hypothetical protein
MWDEEQAGECSALLNNIVLYVGVEDMWQWNFHSSQKICSHQSLSMLDGFGKCNYS